MGLDDTDAVTLKAKGNWQSEKKSNESEKNMKRNKKKNNGDISIGEDLKKAEKEDEEEEEEREASGCWVKFRFRIGCIPSKSDVDASSSLYGTTSTGIYKSSGFFRFLKKAFPLKMKKN